MGNFCGVPTTSHDEGPGSEHERGRIDLLRQLSYDIYKIEGEPDWRNDLEESHLSRRDSKHYYGVRKSPITQMRSQQQLTSSSFRSGSSAGTTATTSNWTRSQQPSSSEMALEELSRAQPLHTDLSSPSSRGSPASSSGTSTYDSNRSLPPTPPPELDLEETARVEKSHRSSHNIPELTI